MTRKKENWVCALANTGCLKQGNVIIQLHYFTLFYRRKEREKKKEGVKHKEKRNSRSLSSNLCNMAHASSCKIAFPFFGLDNLLMFSFYFHLGWYRRRRRRYRHFLVLVHCSTENSTIIFYLFFVHCEERKHEVIRFLVHYLEKQSFELLRSFRIFLQQHFTRSRWKM